MSEAALKVDAVTKSYGSLKALDTLSLAVEQGEDEEGPFSQRSC